jgi:hypothetical protein
MVFRTSCKRGAQFRVGASIRTFAKMRNFCAWRVRFSFGRARAMSSSGYSAVTGLMMVLTSATLSAGKPPHLACSKTTRCLDAFGRRSFS